MSNGAIIGLLVAILVIILGFVIYQIYNNIQTENSLSKTSTFLDYLKLSPSARGGFGEGIVDILLSNLPKDYVKTQYNIPEINARIDFCVNLPNSDIMIPIDSKFILPVSLEKPEEIIFDDREISRLNKEAISRAKEIERYVEPAITTDFVLMYIPDFVYGLLFPETYQELTDMNVIPTNTSGLLSTIFMINMQHRFIKLNSSAKQFGNFQVRVSQGIRRIIENMGKGEKQINHCLNNIVTAMEELERLRENIEDLEIDYEEDKEETKHNIVEC